MAQMLGGAKELGSQPASVDELVSMIGVRLVKSLELDRRLEGRHAVCLEHGACRPRLADCGQASFWPNRIQADGRELMLRRAL